MEETQAQWEYDGSFLGFLTIVDRGFRENSIQNGSKQIRIGELKSIID